MLHFSILVKNLLPKYMLLLHMLGKGLDIHFLLADPPLPPPESMPPLPPEKFAGGEPLPPGVDGSEIPPFNNLQVS